MKTIKLVFTVMAVAVAAIATGVEKPKMNVTPLTVDRAVVSIRNENPAYFEVSIKAENGDLVYYKQSSSPITDYKKIFDFAKMEAGSYVFNFKVNDTKVSNKFEVTSDGILVGEQEMRFDPYFNFKDDLLKLSFLNFDRKQLNLYFYNNNNELVYETELGKDFNITTGFDLSKLEKGTYDVVLSSFFGNYTYTLEK